MTSMFNDVVFDMTTFAIITAAALSLVTSAAFWLTLRNAWRQHMWRRRLADLVTTGVLSLYWSGVLVARLFFGYAGPSVTVTMIGTFVFCVVSIHFLGIAIAQRDVYR